MKKILLIAGLTIWSAALLAQAPAVPTQNANTRFEQLGPTLPTPNTFRTASGAPGKDYFQNRADYDIKVELDDANQKIIGSETVTYHNNSTDELPFIWLQLDQNLFEKGSIASSSAHRRCARSRNEHQRYHQFEFSCPNKSRS